MKATLQNYVELVARDNDMKCDVSQDVKDNNGENIVFSIDYVKTEPEIFVEDLKSNL